MNYTGTSYRHEFYEQLRISLPVIFGNIFYRIPWLISLHMVGSIHPDTEFGSYELAAAALAQTLANVTGMSVGVGLSTALTTLAGQSHGAASFHSAKKDNDGSNDVHRDSENQQLSKPYSSLNYCSTTTYLFRGLFITLLFVFPIGLYWLHGIKPLLIWLGQGEKVSEMTQQYLRLLVPGLWGYSINWTLSAWFQAIGLSDIPTYFAMVIAILHYPFNLFYIYILDLGYIGAALATSTSQIVCPIMMISYMFCTKSGRRRLPLSTRLPTTLADSIIQSVSSIPGILQYLSLAFPGIVIISEWWASEVAVFLAGTLRPGPSFALDGMTIYQAINSFCFMLPVGCSVAGSARVSNLLGAKHPIGANIASNVSIISAAILSVCMGLTLWFVPHNYFPSLFDPDERVISETSLTVPFLSMYVIADGVQVALNGVIKGCGRQPIIMPIVVFAYWFVGLPLAYHFAFVLNKGTTLCEDRYLCGIAGLTAGMTVGTFTHCFLLCIVVLFNTDWALEEQRAQKRLHIDCCIEDESYEEMCILDIDNEKVRYESISATDNTNINTLEFIPVTESETASILSSSPSKAFASSGKLTFAQCEVTTETRRIPLTQTLFTMNNRTTQLLTKLFDKDKSRSALSRAITLLESQLPSDRYQANLLLDALVQKDSIHRNTAPNACHHSNFSVGIAGAPGSGKSTFIERLGLDYILQKKNSMKDIEQRDEESNDQNNCKLAVLCIDPSSNRSGGSILGDKTRMVELSRHDRAFVRPSPNSGTLGGVNCNTADSVVACQAAGYDWTIIETVGLGQSEVEIDYVCDMVILVLAPAAGDDLQGVKKGIMEIADMVVVNKADGHFLNSCKHTVSDYRSAIQFVQRKYDSWSPPVLMASSLTGEGMADVWANIQKFEIFLRSNGELDNKRISQSGYWMWRHVEEEIKSNIRKDPTLVKKVTEVHQMLQSGMISPRSAASTLLLSTFPSSNWSTSDNHDLT